MTSPPPIGAHTEGVDPLAEMAQRSADLVQLFLGDPQSWKEPPPRRDAAELRASGVPIYVHAPYLMNPASGNNRVRIPSRKTLAAVAAAAATIGAAGLIVHGGHVEDDEDLTLGFDRWRKALDSFEADVPILIENTAGGGNAVARELANYGPLWEAIGHRDVGVALDTCHAWAGGEDLATAVDTLRRLTGRVDLVHCNDSRDPHDSRRDRHTALGTGMIPPELLEGVVEAAGAPVVVETPGDAAVHRADIDWLRRRLAGRSSGTA